MLGLCLGSVAVLFIIGCPIWVAFGLGSVVAMTFIYNMPLMDLGTVMFARIDNYVLLAMPLFMLGGNLLAIGGAARAGIKFFDDWMGHLPGGLLICTVLFSTLFAAITGSSIAAIVAIGTLMFPEMIKHGYGRGFTCGVIVTAALLGPIIPPSGGAIIMASIYGLSTASLFACGMIPGLIMSAG